MIRPYCLMLMLIALLGGPASADELHPRLTPGEEVRLEMADGFHNHILIYVPRDYTPDRPWPVVFCYHGYQGKPTTWPIRQMTDGRGVIVVGMDHASEAYHNSPARGTAHQPAEIERFNTVLDILDRHLNIERRRVFMAGFSQGGYTTSVLGEAMLDQLAGLIILGAGRSKGTNDPPSPRRIRNLPIFIGAGEDDDPHGPRAERAERLYRDWGADVTADFWPGTGHTAKTDAPALGEWLIEHDLTALLPHDFERARRLERDDRVRAYHAYRVLAQIADDHPVCQQAREAADAIAADANASIDEAEAALENGRVDEAIRLLLLAREAHAGLDAAERADALLHTIADDPELDDAYGRRIAAMIGRTLRRDAQDAIRAGEQAEAVAMYEQYVEQFPDARDAVAVQSQIDRLKSDPDTIAQIRDAEAIDAARPLMEWAETFLACGQPDRAEPLLLRIVDEHPDTTFADRAATWLDRGARR